MQKEDNRHPRIDHASPLEENIHAHQDTYRLNSSHPTGASSIQAAEHKEVQNGFQSSVEVHVESDQLDESSMEAHIASTRARVLANLGIGERLAPETSPEALLAALQHEESTMREKAARTLGKVGAQGTGNVHGRILVTLQIMAFTDREWKVRQASIKALSKIEASSSLSLLASILERDTSPVVRTAAVSAIGALGKDAPIGLLITALRDSEWRVREAVVEAIGEIGERGCLHFVLQALEDEDDRVRVAAIYALRTLQGKMALPRLICIAQGDRSWSMREAAIDILEELGEISLAEQFRAAMDALLDTSDQLSLLKTGEEKNTSTFAPSAVPSTNDHGKGMETVEVESVQPTNPCEFQTGFTRTSPSHIPRHRWLPKNVMQWTRTVPGLCLAWRRTLLSFIEKTWRKQRDTVKCLAVFIGLMTLALSLAVGQASHPSSAADDNAQRSGPIKQQIVVAPRTHILVEVRFINSGTTVWSEAEGYQLACSIRENNCIGSPTSHLGIQDVLPGQHHIFDVALIAPSQPGSYRISWHMDHRGRNFGETSTLFEVLVQAPQHQTASFSDNCIFFCGKGIFAFPLFPLTSKYDHLSWTVKKGKIYIVSLEENGLNCFPWSGCHEEAMCQTGHAPTLPEAWKGSLSRENSALLKPHQLE